VSEKKSLELRVSVDVGSRRHSVAIGLPNGEVLEEFEISHRVEGFQEFFSRIEKHQKEKNCGVAVAMQGYNRYARPLDTLVRQPSVRAARLKLLCLFVLRLTGSFASRGNWSSSGFFRLNLFSSKSVRQGDVGRQMSNVAPDARKVGFSGSVHKTGRLLTRLQTPKRFK
jgi:hypothetical protein